MSMFARFNSFLSSLSRGRFIVLMTFVVVAFGGLLFVMGQPPIFKGGFITLWQGEVISPQNSQQISDWYTFSHIIHGFLFYGFLWLFRTWLPLRSRILLAFGIEIAWEFFENTDFIINRYREATIALDYFGDSVLNSVCDVLAMGIGFYLAHKWPWWASLATIIGLELYVGYVIRDNLTLNVLMLLYPLEAVKEWQSAGL